MTITGDFDLNIETVLEAWSTSHAIREFIANALDEQVLSGTAAVQICRRDGIWEIRDFGRGLRYTHLTQNESVEKHSREAEVIGRFGVGLKDALAVLARRGIDVRIRSRHCDVSLVHRSKADFSDVKTLHARVARSPEERMSGTRVGLRGITDHEMDAAKRFFLAFADDHLIERTRIGEVLRRKADSPARIYVKGLVVAEEENFAFSYNITSLTEPMRRALNRERTNVGRGAYSDRIKSILLASESNEVASVLASDLSRVASGASYDEVKLWSDVGLRAAQVLNARSSVLFVTSSEMLTSGSLVDIATREGRDVIVVPDTIRNKLDGNVDIDGNKIQSLRQFASEWNESFKYEFIAPSELSSEERALFNRWRQLAEFAGGLPACVREVSISRTMRPAITSGFDADGVWDATSGSIVMSRNVLTSPARFAGTFLHELAHARSGEPDVSRGFESELTQIIGQLGSRIVSGLSPISDDEQMDKTPAESQVLTTPQSMQEGFEELIQRCQRVQSPADAQRVLHGLPARLNYSFEATAASLLILMRGIQTLARAQIEMYARLNGCEVDHVSGVPTLAVALLGSFVTNADDRLAGRSGRKAEAISAFVEECRALLKNPRSLTDPSAFAGAAEFVAALFDASQPSAESMGSPAVIS